MQRYPTSVEMEERLFSYGISECIRQPFNENLIRLKVRNVVKLFQYQNELEEKIKQQKIMAETVMHDFPEMLQCLTNCRKKMEEL